DTREGKRELSLRDQLAIDACESLNLSAILVGRNSLGLEVDSVSRSYHVAKFGLLHSHEESVKIMAPALPHRGLNQDPSELGERFQDQSSRHDRVSWEVVYENVIGQRDTLDAGRHLWWLERCNSIEKNVPHRRVLSSPGAPSASRPSPHFAGTQAM